MKQRRLGKTNFNVSELGFGAWGTGRDAWLGGSDHESLEALRAAIARGINFIDTALIYGSGRSEHLVASAVSEADRKVFIATKIPPKNRIWPAPRGIGLEEAFPADYIVRTTEESLRNLGGHTIDLQQLHVWSDEWFERDEWRRAFEDLKTSGKVRAIGVSLNDHDPDSGLRLVESGLVDTVQVVYNIFDQSPERNLFPACVKHDVGVIARSPLDEGALSGHVTEHATFPEGDFRNQYFRGERKKEVAERVVALLNDLHLEDMTRLPEIALRFCLSDPAVSTIIPGMRTAAHVDENLTACGRGPLYPEMLEIVRRHVWAKNFYN